MKINDEGLNIIKEFEGCYLDAYLCPAGVPTIGYGHVRNVKLGDKITIKEAERLLMIDLKAYEDHVNTVNNNYHYDFNDNEFSALVSFAFNIGSIWQLTQYGRRNKFEIGEHIMSYNKAGGKILSGLVRRRLAERNLYITPVSGFSDDEIIGVKH